jgi:hypothetical protein
MLCRAGHVTPLPTVGTKADVISDHTPFLLYIPPVNVQLPLGHRSASIALVSGVTKLKPIWDLHWMSG